MLRYAADENFTNDILRGLQRRDADLDVVRVQDVELSGAADPAILDWAAREGRIVLSHDVGTMVGFAYERIGAGQAMPGLFEVSRTVPPGEAIDDLLVLAHASLGVLNHPGESPSLSQVNDTSSEALVLSGVWPRTRSS